MWKTGGHLRFQDGRATVLQLHIVITPSKSEFSWDPTPVLPSGGHLSLSPHVPQRLNSCAALWWSFTPQSSLSHKDFTLVLPSGGHLSLSPLVPQRLTKACFFVQN